MATFRHPSVGPAGKITPLYHQIACALRSDIEEGVYNAGEPLPGELELTERFGVSRITACRALDELEAQGRVVRRQGKGTFVADRPIVRPMRTSITELLRHTREITDTTQPRTLAYGWSRPPVAVAAKLAIPPGEDVLVHRLVRVGLDGPTMFVVNVFPAAVARQFDPEVVGHEPIITLLERIGIDVGGGEQTVSSVAADPEVSQILVVAAGAPLTVIERLLSDKAGTPVSLVRLLIRPDRYELTMTLELETATPVAPLGKKRRAKK